MCTVSFKERVKDEAIANARLYEANFINFEYLICSEAFDNYYHIIKSDKGNYLHLIGIHTDLTAEDFLRMNRIHKEGAITPADYLVPSILFNGKKSG